MGVPVKIAEFLRASILKNVCERLLLLSYEYLVRAATLIHISSDPIGNECVRGTGSH